MSEIKFRLAAKTDVGLVRQNNEDNFQASADLSQSPMRWVNNQTVSLGDKGALLVVADGMGGMNAGEVASEIAIQTVKDYFRPENLTPEIMKSRFTIEKFMNEVIVEADARIKKEAKANPETKGMGTTLVIGWIIDGKLYVSWCGDSRAYVYNPDAGLHQISKDHSYVQNLVDKGAISHEEAFDYPESNIITRCLSDASVKAKPESLLKPYELCDNDIVMLCTDGLSGMIRDGEIESIMEQNLDNLDVMADKLIEGACDAEGSDNITICLCQILSGGLKSNPEAFTESDARIRGMAVSSKSDTQKEEKPVEEVKPNVSKRNNFFMYGFFVLALLLIGGGIWWWIAATREIPVVETEQVKGVPVPENAIEAEPQNQLEAENVETPSKETTKPERVETDNPISESNQEENVAEEEQIEINPDDVLNPVGNIKGKIAEPEQPSEPEIIEYEVQKGDTYSGLSKKFNTSVERLQELNKGISLRAGDKILVPKN